MNNKMIGLIVVALIVIGAVAAFMMKKDSGTETSGAQSQNEVMGTSKAQKTLRQLLAGGVQMCSFSANEGGSATQGTLYTMNGQMRGDFQSSSEGQVYNSHMIIKDDITYVWTDGLEGGLKIAFSEQQTPGVEGENQSINPNEPVDADCSAWSADRSKFDLPDIEFTDLSAMMDDGQMASPTAPPSAGGNPCDQVPASAREACLEALAQ